MMDELLRKVKKELSTIADKGLTSSNLDTTYKLIDIYKDIKEADYYEKCNEESELYGARSRDSRGRYRGDEDDYDRSYRRGGNSGNYNHDRYYPLDERDERYFTRIREGLYNYNEGKNRYRDGDSKDRMIDGVDMAMGALVNFVEYMMDNVETSQEKEVIRKHIDKLKKM